MPLDFVAAKEIVQWIKTELFDTGKSNPYRLDTLSIRAELQKSSHAETVSYDDWLVLFKREATEWLLSVEKKNCAKIRKSEKGTSLSVALPALSTKSVLRSHSRSNKPKAPRIKSKFCQDSHLKKMLTKMPKELSPPTIILQWDDYKHNHRLHLLVQLPAGTEESDVSGILLVQAGSTLQFHLQWKPLMLDAEKMFSHSRFESNYYNPRHPKVLSMQADIDEFVGADDCVKAVVAIKLPEPRRFKLTPKSLSGHREYMVLLDKDYNDKGVAQPGFTSILFVDLVEKRDVQVNIYSSRKKAALTDDFQIG